MEKFIRKLKRELTRNPKKTALLGGGLLIAVYFWAPLIAKWTSNGETPPAVTEEAPAAVASESPEGAATPKTESNSIPDWRTLAREIELNQSRNLADLAAPDRDPFFLSAAAIAKADALREAEAPEAPEPATVAPHRTLNDLNLKLEAILLRGSTRVAIVAGAIYREGDRIAVAEPPPAGGGEEETGANEAADVGPVPEPELVAIRADYVVVRWKNEMLRLELERPTLAPGDRITPHG